jgi:RHH-type proline utilization regulon transcriptional repressor/proline dehydrogenase/delta 1-pyrroline-5-carboxylate dehydrogenase
VIYKPAPEAVLTGRELIQVFWEAGVPKNQLQFLPISDDQASVLVQDPRVDCVVLTGGTATAKKILSLRPGLDLIAETGGKNSLIVTALSDRDLAVGDIVQSAFGFSGQKCSACSLAILEAEVYHDLKFRRQLKDAVASLPVGSAWDFASKITPLIRAPEGPLLKAMTTLDPGEEWLLEPKITKEYPQLLSPGIKWGVKPGSFSHTHELFGPLLSVMCADDLSHAVDIANATAYGLTAGLHSLDEREHFFWLDNIIAGNCYINRGITGALVERQPFGGTKLSQFGPGAKSGGPNYLLQLMRVRCLKISTDSYKYYWTHFFSKDHDPMKLLGQDNIQRYKPLAFVELRLHPEDALADIEKVIAAASMASTPLKISCSQPRIDTPLQIESDEAFITRISKYHTPFRVRLLQMPSNYVVTALCEMGAWIVPSKPLNQGRFELLHYLREVSVSYSYHRYGNVGVKRC